MRFIFEKKKKELVAPSPTPILLFSLEAHFIKIYENRLSPTPPKSGWKLYLEGPAERSIVRRLSLCSNSRYFPAFILETGPWFAACIYSQERRTKTCLSSILSEAQSTCPADRASGTNSCNPQWWPTDQTPWRSFLPLCVSLVSRVPHCYFCCCCSEWMIWM